MTPEKVPLLRVAIEREDWETAALCLLLGVARIARRYPAGVIEEIVAELAGDATEGRHRARRRRARDRN